MPSSAPDTIPVALRVAYQLAPRSVLDLGIGFGKYGVLFREYLELKHSNGANTADLGVRRVRIDGVEGFSAYLGPLQRLVYDAIYVENITDFVRRDWRYDFVFIGDTLEHIEKDLATDYVLPRLIAGADMGVLVSVPNTVEEQGAVFQNDLEIHRSRWKARDFACIAPYSVVGRKEGSLIAFLTGDERCYRLVRGNPIRDRIRGLRQGLRDRWF